MDDDAQSESPRDTALSRRAFFGRTFALAGGAAAVLALSACPGGEGDGDDDDDEGDEGDDD